MNPNPMHIYLVVCVCIFAFLMITNIVWVSDKFYSLPRRISEDSKSKCAWIMCEISRTFYLSITTAGTIVFWWCQDTTIDGFFPSVKKFPCVYYRYLSVFVWFGAISLPRFIFGFCRIYLTRRMLGQIFGNWTKLLLGCLLCCMCTVIYKTETQNPVIETPYEGHLFCYTHINNDLYVFWISVMTSVEVAMLWLYIYPLYKLDLSRGRKFYQVLAYKNVQKDLDCPLMTREQSYHGISIESSAERRRPHSCSVASNMIKNYHRSVMRNFWSGILGAFVSIQFMIIFLVLYSYKKIGIKYITSGIFLVHATFTFFTIYICLVISDRHWLQALIPCQRELPKETLRKVNHEIGVPMDEGDEGRPQKNLL